GVVYQRRNASAYCQRVGAPSHARQSDPTPRAPRDGFYSRALCGIAHARTNRRPYRDESRLFDRLFSPRGGRDADGVLESLSNSTGARTFGKYGFENHPNRAASRFFGKRAFYADIRARSRYAPKGVSAGETRIARRCHFKRSREILLWIQTL